MSRAVVRVPEKPRAKTPEELEREDLLARLEALEAEARRKNPEFKVPEPPAGLERRRVTEG